MLKKLLYILMFILLVVSLILSAIDFRYAALIDSIIIIIFGIDTVFNIYKSDSKSDYVKSHPLEIISMVPVSPFFRLFKTFSIVYNFLRLTIIGKKYILPVTKVMREFVVGRLMIYFILIFFILPLPMMWLEPNITGYSDLLWWSLQTITTVGYGDIVISSTMGRIIASLLMILGIGMISTFTSGITQLVIKRGMNKKELVKRPLHVESKSDDCDTQIALLEKMEALIKAEKEELLKEKK